jgi:biotin transporter BioY
MAAGLAIIFACGLWWLTIQLAPTVGAQAFQLALQQGLYPFVLVDVVKLFVAGAVLPGVWKLIGR